MQGTSAGGVPDVLDPGYPMAAKRHRKVLEGADAPAGMRLVGLSRHSTLGPTVGADLDSPGLTP